MADFLGNTLHSIMNPSVPNAAPALNTILQGAQRSQDIARKDMLLADEVQREQDLISRQESLRDSASLALAIKSQPMELRNQALATQYQAATDAGDNDKADAMLRLMNMDNPSLESSLDELIFQGSKFLPAGALQGAGMGGPERFGRVVEGVDDQDNPIFAQVGSKSTVRPVEGFRPVTSESKANAAALKEQKVQEEKLKALQNQENRLKLQQQKIDKGAMDLADRKIKLNQSQAKKEASGMESAALFDLGNQLQAANLDLIFGRGESLLPEMARSQEGIDLIALKDRYMAALQLGAAGKLKGQGTITENERAILKDSIAALSNPNISPELAAAEFKRANDVIADSMAGEGFKRPEAAPDMTDNNDGTFTLPDGTVIRRKQ